MRALAMRALAVLALLALAHPALADDRATAERYFNAGAAAYRRQSFAAAAAQFELAYAALPLPEIAFSAAQAYRRQYYVDPKPEYVKRAVALYRIYLAKVKTGGRVADAADGVAEMQRELDRLISAGATIGEVEHGATRIAVSAVVAGERATGMTELSPLPPEASTGAKATLDGQPLELYAPVACAPGEHAITVTADGYAAVHETRRVVEGATELVEVTLQPLPAHLVVTAERGAVIALDGHTLGVAPLAEQSVAPGPHTLAVTRRGREPVERAIALARDGHQAIDVPLATTSRRRAVPPLAIAAGALALGTIAAGVVAYHYDRDMISLDDERLKTGITTAQLADYRNDVRLRDDLRDTAFGLGAGAAALGLTALALYAFDVPMLRERVVPVAAPGGGGVSVVGRF